MSWTQSFHNRPRVYDLLHAARLAPALSQTHSEERACVCRHARTAMVAVEIGTYMGVTAAEISKALQPGARLYCVDPYFNGQSIRAIAHRHLAREGALKNIHLVESTLQDAEADLPDQVDFFFVDGDHSRSGLQADWEVVKRLIRPGGVVAFHDCKEVPGSNHISWEAIGYFDEVIAKDTGFIHLESCHSLQVIRRKDSSVS